MKLFAPSYYNKFKCIAEKCKHSCCVGWEIHLDSETFDKYDTLPMSARSDILRHTVKTEHGAKIVLGEDKRCPFLSDCGLCGIISEYGDEYTSEICREHPRFYNIVGNRAEVGLGASCEEAARIILSSFDPFTLENIGEISVPIEDCSDFDAIFEREKIYGILKEEGLGFYGKIDRIKEEYRLSDALFSDYREAGFARELELLSESHREIFIIKGWGGGDGFSNYLLRYFVYLLYRHLALSESYTNMRARLAFCILLTMMLENFIKCKENVAFEDICDAARIISEEIEYSEANTETLIFNLEVALLGIE